MYFKLYERFICGRTPFHNRMLRSNYALPEDVLYGVIGLCLGELLGDGEKLLFCGDGVEDGRVGERNAVSVDRGEAEKMLVPSGDGLAAGFFNEEMSFYIRASLEPEQDVAPGEIRGGEFELYCGDAAVDRLYGEITARWDGFFIVESAKKHLEEIML